MWQEDTYAALGIVMLLWGQEQRGYRDQEQRMNGGHVCMYTEWGEDVRTELGIAEHLQLVAGRLLLWLHVQFSTPVG